MESWRHHQERNEAKSHLYSGRGFQRRAITRLMEGVIKQNAFSDTPFAVSAHEFIILLHESWVAKEFANWVNHLMCSAQQLLLLHCLGAEQSLIHNHRCIFTAAAQEEPTARVLCTCNYANLSTPLVRSLLLLCCV